MEAEQLYTEGKEGQDRNKEVKEFLVFNGNEYKGYPNSGTQ